MRRECDPYEERFLEFGAEAQIRAFLEQAVGNFAWFSRRAKKGGVTKEVIFGTVNHVSRACSNNPIMPRAGLAQLALSLPKRLSSRGEQ